MKSICIPATPPVDIQQFLPIVDHPCFQKLRERKQLGINYVVFPGAVHTRFEHTIGVLALAQRICRIQNLNDDDDKLLQAFALLHDIGHGPFSHQIEPVLHDDHHDIGIKRIQLMVDAIKQCKLNPDDLIDMFQKNHPLAIWISDRNLGADKLDYLMRDALHIGFHGTPDIEKLQFNTTMTPQGLAIDAKYLEDIKQLQKYYSYLHQHGYLNKTALIAQRILQRAIVEELNATSSDGNELWDMTDAQLMAHLDNLNAPLARHLVAQLQPPNLQKTFLAIKPEGYAFVENHSPDNCAVIQWPTKYLQTFTKRFDTQKDLMELENNLAEYLGCQPADILVAPMPFFKKLIPKDVQISNHASADTFWLLQHDKDHKRSLESDYLRTFAIRLTAPPALRTTLAKKAPAIADFILEKLL